VNAGNGVKIMKQREPYYMGKNKIGEEFISAAFI
jgi:hypothetical protein